MDERIEQVETTRFPAWLKQRIIERCIIDNKSLGDLYDGNEYEDEVIDRHFGDIINALS